MDKKDEIAAKITQIISPSERTNEIIQKLSAHLNPAIINALLTQEEIGQVQAIWENTNLSYIEAFSIFLLEGHGYITLPNKDIQPWDDNEYDEYDENYMNMSAKWDWEDDTEEALIERLEQEIQLNIEQSKEEHSEKDIPY